MLGTETESHHQSARVRGTKRGVLLCACCSVSVWPCPLTGAAQVRARPLMLAYLPPGGRQRAGVSFSTAVLSLLSGGERLTDVQCDRYSDGGSEGVVRRGGGVGWGGGGGREGGRARWAGGTAREECGEDIQLSFLGAVPFPPNTVSKAICIQFRALTLCWRTREKLCVSGGHRQGVSHPYPISPEGICF